MDSDSPEYIGAVGSIGLKKPWQVAAQDSALEADSRPFYIVVEAPRATKYPCPECGLPCCAHDFKRRCWRHRNVLQRHCYIQAAVPRTNCKQHGIRLAAVPWARKRSSFTRSFEQGILALVKNMPISAVARIAEVSDKNIWRMVLRCVDEAKQEMELSALRSVASCQIQSKIAGKLLYAFVDTEKQEVVYATACAPACTTIAKQNVLQGFVNFLEQHRGHPQQIEQLILPAESSALARELFANAEVVVAEYAALEELKHTCQAIRRRAKGYRNTDTFMTMLYLLTSPAAPMLGTEKFGQNPQKEVQLVKALLRHLALPERATKTGPPELWPESLPESVPESVSESVPESVPESVQWHLQDEFLAYLGALIQQPQDAKIQQALGQAVDWLHTACRLAAQAERGSQGKQCQQVSWGVEPAISNEMVAILLQQRIVLIALEFMISNPARCKGQSLREHWLGLYVVLPAEERSARPEGKNSGHSNAPVAVNITRCTFEQTDLRGSQIDFFGFALGLRHRGRKGSILYLDICFRDCLVEGLELLFWRCVAAFSGVITVRFEGCADFAEEAFPYLQKSAKGQSYAESYAESHGGAQAAREYYYFDLEKWQLAANCVHKQAISQDLADSLRPSESYALEHLR